MKLDSDIKKYKGESFGPVFNRLVSYVHQCEKTQDLAGLKQMLLIGGRIQKIAAAAEKKILLAQKNSKRLIASKNALRELILKIKRGAADASLARSELVRSYGAAIAIGKGDQEFYNLEYEARTLLSKIGSS